MDEKTTALIEKLADKFGTTAEHLWGVLVRQAPISGTVNLIIVVVLVSIAICTVMYVKRKTTTLKKPMNRGYRSAYDEMEWDCEQAFVGRLIAVSISFAAGLVAISSANKIVAAFLNPEYWALSQILK